jgi:glycerol-3-phosphate dehydrogenase
VDRNLAIQAISDRSTVWDCLVIGGGATGLGTAVEAASRGLRTLLVEKTDFAKGTSSRATKLAHGGVRYLEQGNISLVREALHERGLMLKNAPHLAHPLKFVIPAYRLWEKFKRRVESYPPRMVGIGRVFYRTLPLRRCPVSY